MSKSLAEIIAEMSPEEQAAAMEGLDPEALLWDWSFWSRPEQVFPDDNSWSVGLVLAGRGFGKTRCAAEWVREQAKYTNTGKRHFGLVARTAADVRDVLVQGESGILAVSPPSEQPIYQPTNRSLRWPNGNTGLCFTADEPNALRGPAFDCAWADELAAWRRVPDDSGLTAWDNLRIATRSGPNPQIVATTTPKRVPALYDLLKEKKEGKRIYVQRGSTADNAGNLAEIYLEGLYGLYRGTHLAAQELDGEMLDDLEGALWTRDLIEDNRQGNYPPGLPLRCIGVDPSIAENPKDYCGIVAVASTGERDLYKRRAWVLEDSSVLGSPDVWAQRVVAMARKWGCPVVAEVNQGGALVTNAIRTIDPTIKVYEVHSKFGKSLRAEPIVMAYQQKRVHHVNAHVDLEEQMLSWIPGEGKSPDRVDALVHALTALMIRPPVGFLGGYVTAHSLSDRRIPPDRGRNRPMDRGRANFRVRKGF